MKLLVLAQTPPPVHGQSVMVRTLVNGLPTQGIAVHHVNFRLSQDGADIGRWRIGKIFSVLGACVRTIFARFIHRCDVLYYVPAPAKRGALYRDWVVMFFCRIFFRHTVLHWHATGLSDWLNHHATWIERAVSKLLLGRVSLSVVLGKNLQADALYFRAKKISIVANGVADPGAPTRPTRPTNSPLRLLFVGQCSEEKGFFASVRALVAANRAHHCSIDAPMFTLTAAGEFPNRDAERRFTAVLAEHPFELSHVGLVTGEKKSRLFHESHVLCLPSHYAAEGQPLVLLEAMACDLAVIATRWRGIPETLPSFADLITPGDDEALLQAVLRQGKDRHPAGAFREHYLGHFTIEKHLSAFADAVNEMVL